MTASDKKSNFGTPYLFHSQDQFENFYNSLLDEADERDLNVDFEQDGNKFQPEKFPCTVSANLTTTKVLFKIKNGKRDAFSVSIVGDGLVYEGVYENKPSYRNLYEDICNHITENEIKDVDPLLDTFVDAINASTPEPDSKNPVIVLAGASPVTVSMSKVQLIMNRNSWT